MVKGESQLSVLRDSHIQPLININIIVAHASVTSGKTKLELGSHADTCVLGDNCLVIHDHNRPVNVYSYDPKDDHRSAKTFISAEGY